MPNFLEPYNQFSEHDERILSSLVNEVSRGVFCEIGCWTGHSTSIIAKRAKELNTVVVVIDNFKGNEGTPLDEFARDNNVRDIFFSNMNELGFCEGTVLLHEDSSNNAHKYIDNSLSFLFIDASHKYDDVKKDLLNYKDKVVDGGIICGHDYESDTYDERYINEDYVEGKHHGVIKAVNEVFGKVEHDGRMWWVK